MGGLDSHFGENASLDPVTQADILRFLETNAADTGSSQIGRRVMQGMNAKDAPLRITETRWFVRKHDEVARSTWSRKSVGSRRQLCGLSPESGTRPVRRTRGPDSEINTRG